MALNCINEKIKEFLAKKPETVKRLAESGYVSKARLDDSERLATVFREKSAEFDQLLKDYATTHGDQSLTLSKEAAEYAYETLQRRINFRTKEALLVHEKANTLVKNLDSVYQNHGIEFPDAIDAIHHGDVGLAVKGMLPEGKSFYSRMDSYKSLYGSQISEPLDYLIPHYFSNDDKAGMEVMNAVESLIKGETTTKFSKEVVQHAKSLQGWSEGMASDLERAGVDIKGRKDYLLGAFSNVEAIRKTPREVFVESMLQRQDRLDISNIQEFAPGVADTPGQLKAFLSHFYDSKISNGQIKPGDFPVFKKRGVSAVVNARGEHRLLQFKDAETAMWYNKTYGHGGLYETLMGLTERHARHMALTETYTPNPGALISSVKRQLVTKYGPRGLSAVEKLTDNVREGSKVDFRDVVSPSTKAIVGSVTDQFRASVLGSAAIPSYFQDTMNASIGNAMRGMPWLSNYVKGFGAVFNPALRQDAQELAKMGYMMAHFQDAMMNSSRAPHLTGVQRYAKKALTAVMKLSLLERQTLGQKVVNIKGAGIHLAEWLNGEEIHPRLQNYLNSVGITEADKSLLREAITKANFHGHDFDIVDLNKLFSSGDSAKMDAAVKLSTIVSDVSEIAAPVASSKAGQFWAHLSNTNKTGYFITKATQPLTSFVTSHYQNVLRPILKQEGLNRLQFLAAYTIANITTGALIVQIQRALTGKDTLPFGPELAIRAGTQAALGNVLGTLVNYGSSGSVIEDSMALLRVAKTMGNIPVHAFQDISKGKPGARLTKDSMAFLKYLVPGQNLWYSKLMMERYVFDQLENLVDHQGFQQRVSRRIQNERKKKSNFYWKPGSTEPQRTPQ